jgi:hypothetical protein
VLELDEIHSHDGILFNKFGCQYALSGFKKLDFSGWLRHLANQEEVFGSFAFGGIDKAFKNQQDNAMFYLDNNIK